jgi:hypothetical protein
MYYDSRLVHTLRSREGTKARLLACIAQPRMRRGTGALDRTVD